MEEKAARVRKDFVKCVSSVDWEISMSENGSEGDEEAMGISAEEIEALNPAEVRQRLEELRERASVTDEEVRELEERSEALEARSKIVKRRLEALSAQ